MTDASPQSRRESIAERSRKLEGRGGVVAKERAEGGGGERIWEGRGRFPGMREMMSPPTETTMRGDLAFIREADGRTWRGDISALLLIRGDEGCCCDNFLFFSSMLYH